MSSLLALRYLSPLLSYVLLLFCALYFQTVASGQAKIAQEFFLPEKAQTEASNIYQEFQGSFDSGEHQRNKIFLSSPIGNLHHPLSKWSFFPGKRAGLRFDEMTSLQRYLTQEWVRLFVSEVGQLKWNAIVGLEDVLKDLSRNPDSGEFDASRDTGQYALALFGKPGVEDLWGWRLEGHHISIRFLFRGWKLISTTPSFLGAAPTVPRSGPMNGMTLLGEEERIALMLVKSLKPSQLKLACPEKPVPSDVTLGPGHPQRPEASGILRSQLDRSQQMLLDALLRIHLEFLNPSIYRSEWDAAVTAGLDSISFTWWGPLVMKSRHGYRLQGPTTIVELVRVTGSPGHVHIVRRSPGEDLDSPEMLRDLQESLKNPSD